MTRAHYGQILSFEPPPAWADRSSIVLVPNDPKAGAPSIAVARWPRPANTKLRDAVTAHVTAMMVRAPGLRVVSNGGIHVDAREAREVRITGMTGERGDALEQITVYIDAPEGDLVIVTCTWVAGFEACAVETLHRMLATATFTLEVRR